MNALISLAILSLIGNHSSYNGIEYRFFEVDARNEKIVFYKKPADIKKESSPLMVTNGGMFDPDYSPHGLLVVDHKLYHKLDARTAKGANFYVHPNGVFFVDQGKYGILPTREYATLYPKEQPDFATQSGPMLVINDSINPIFDKHSEYINTRSGVGILPNGNTIFVIADFISFYDFAAIFKNVYHCKNALFLDGGISEMLIGETEESDLPNHKFGPTIAVYKK